MIRYVVHVHLRFMLFSASFSSLCQIVLVSTRAKYVVRAALLNNCLYTYLVGGGDSPPFVLRTACTARNTSLHCTFLGRKGIAVFTIETYLTREAP